jgi:Fic family protein
VRREFAGKAFVPAPLQTAMPTGAERTRIVGSLHPLLDEAKTNLTRLDEIVGALPSPDILISPMLQREAQTSSQIENTHAELDEVALAAINPASARGPSAEVARNLDAIRHGLTSPLPVCVRLLTEMHGTLITDTKARPGQLRDRQVWIGDSTDLGRARFVPPPADRVLACLETLMEFINSAAPARERWPDLIELALAHYQLETIHPFSDGNGRIGRALVNITPVKRGVLKHAVCNISGAIEPRRREYYDAMLRVSTHGDWEGWIEFFLSALAAQSRADLHRAKALGDLYNRTLANLVGKKRSTLTIKLVDWLFETPAISIPFAANLLDCEYSTAKRHVQLLVESGLLVARHDVTYDKWYISWPIIRAAEGSTPSARGDRSD